MVSMSDLERVTGLVLRTYASGDSDLVLRILTKERGKISAIAKHTRSTRKTSASTLDLFDCGEFELRQGRAQLKVVKSFSPSTTMHHLREGLDVLTLASVACEVADLLHIEEGGPAEHALETAISGLKGMSALQPLRANCAILFKTVAELLSDAGFLDPEELGRGSRDGLVTLLRTVESCSERQLNSRLQLEEVLKRL
jgi:DNA repair protein RecO